MYSIDFSLCILMYTINSLKKLFTYTQFFHLKNVFYSLRLRDVIKTDYAILTESMYKRIFMYTLFFSNYKQADILMVVINSYHLIFIQLSSTLVSPHRFSVSFFKVQIRLKKYLLQESDLLEKVILLQYLDAYTSYTSKPVL